MPRSGSHLQRGVWKTATSILLAREQPMLRSYIVSPNWRLSRQTTSMRPAALLHRQNKTAWTATHRRRYRTQNHSLRGPKRASPTTGTIQTKHAMYLARTLKPVRDRDVSLEEYALAGEEPITRIAGSLDLVAELDEGFEGPTDSIIESVESLQNDSYELNEQRNQIVMLEQEIQRLESELGTQSVQLAAQEAQRRQIRQIEGLFAPGEAQVLTQGQNILIRPIGLVFPSGSAQIEVEYFGLLRKVQDALRVFPDRVIVVEGHTDSFGGDEANLALSQERAEAVRSYLLANMRDLSPDDVKPVGYGEARPVANNETVEGRAKNRRIDVVIQPKAADVQISENN